MDPQIMEIAKSILDICVQYGKSAIAETEANEKLQKILTDSSIKSSTSFVFDIFEMADLLVTSMQIETEAKKKISTILKDTLDGIIPEDLVRCNMESLIEDGSVPGRQIRLKTKLFFKQLKFNLFREESEGYAKLITELCQYETGISPVETLNRIRCLIGQFNLDPNRALDIILECFESALDSSTSTAVSTSSNIGQSKIIKYYIDLLKAYQPNADDMAHIIGFKFSFYSTKRAAAAAEISTPSSLYLLAAVLIEQRMIDIAELCTYLSPKYDEIMAEQKEATDAANRRSKSLGASALGPDWDPYEGINEETAVSGEETHISNQKIGLTQALLRLDAWKDAKYIIDRLPEFYAVRHPRVAVSLCRLIDSRIGGVYARYCPQFCVAASSKTDEAIRNQASLGEFVREVLPIVAYLGPQLSTDTLLMTKLIRICTAAYAQANSATDADPDIASSTIIEICEDVLLPSLPPLRTNGPMAEELWALMCRIPYTTRFRMYGRLKNEHEKRHPSLIVAHGETLGKARYIMKRISKETTKVTARQLGKLTHSCSSSIFDYILNQIQYYENLIAPVVDSLKFLNSLSYDALAYSIIEQLASPEKEKLKVSDATLSPWLQSLATFVGTVCKQYKFELTGILQYVANQLKSGKSFDLLVLRKIIEEMSNFEASRELTREQIESLCGGDNLKNESNRIDTMETMRTLGETRSTGRRAAGRLKEALMQEDLVVSLCILMAQQRGCIVFDEGPRMHLKLAGQMLDQCQDTLVQFGDFLASSWKSEDYARRMPSAPELMTAYYLPPETAMFLARPAYKSKIVAKYDELKKADRANKISVTDEKKLEYYKRAWNFVYAPLSEELEKMNPSKTWIDIKPRIFCLFWTLTAYDLYVPREAYEREMERVRKVCQQFDDSRELFSADHKRRKEKERYQQLEQKLSDEQRRHNEHVERVMSKLTDERHEWFSKTTRIVIAMGHFIQMCLMPRILFSDVDAMYAAKFIVMLHKLKTPNFSTLICYDKIFCDLGPIVFALSENEANHFGLFLCTALETIMHWYQSEENFTKECSTYPGFVTKFRAPGSDTENQVVNYQTFRQVFYKWHGKLGRILIMAMNSMEYVPTRNALLVLRKILPHFPCMSNMHSAIEKRVAQLRDDEKDQRQDLHALAASYWGKLKMRKTPLIMEEEKKTPSPSKPRIVASSAVITPEKVIPSTNRQATTAISSSDGGKSKSTVQNGTPAAVSSSSTTAKPSTTTGSRVTIRKGDKTATSTVATKKPTSTNQNSDTTATTDGEQTNAVKRPMEKNDSTEKKTSRQQQQVQKSSNSAAPSSPASNSTSTSTAPINGGATAATAGTKSSSSNNGGGGQQQSTASPNDGEPKPKRSRRSADAEDTTSAASPTVKSTPIAATATITVDGSSPKRTSSSSSKKPAEKVEEAEPKSKRRKIEDQSPRRNISEKHSAPIITTANYTPITSTATSTVNKSSSSSPAAHSGTTRRGGEDGTTVSSDRRGGGGGGGIVSETRGGERSEKSISRTSSHVVLASSERSHDKDKRSSDASSKRDRSPKSSTQSPVLTSSGSSASRKKEVEDSKNSTTQSSAGHERGSNTTTSSSSTTERRRLKLSSTSTSISSAVSGPIKQSSVEKVSSSSKYGGGSISAMVASKGSRDDERRSSRSRKD